MENITTANAVWIATAILHKENPGKNAFRTTEIFDKVNSLGIIDVSPDTIKMHISSHCVADGKKSPDIHKKLTRVGTGWYRLYVQGDKCHEDRKNGTAAPIKESIPEKYRYLVDWYYEQYTKSMQKTKPSIMQTIQENYDTFSEKSKNIQHSQLTDGNMIKVPNNILKLLNVKTGEHIAFVVDDNNVTLKKAKINVQILE